MSLSLILKDGKILLKNGEPVAGDPDLDGFGNCCCGKCCIPCRDFVNAGPIDYYTPSEDPNDLYCINAIRGGGIVWKEGFGPGMQLPCHGRTVWECDTLGNIFDLGRSVGTGVFKWRDENGECVGDCTSEEKFTMNEDGWICREIRRTSGCFLCGDENCGKWDYTECAAWLLDPNRNPNDPPAACTPPIGGYSVRCVNHPEEGECGVADIGGGTECIQTLCGNFLNFWTKATPDRWIDGWTKGSCYNSCSDLNPNPYFECETCRCLDQEEINNWANGVDGAAAPEGIYDTCGIRAASCEDCPTAECDDMPCSSSSSSSSSSSYSPGGGGE